MSEELLVNVTPRETRVAVVENGMLQELHIERGSQRGVVGNIYKGKVQRVMPGMQAAFVDIGLDRAAFLHANDIFRSAQLDAGEVDDETAGRLRDVGCYLSRAGALAHDGSAIRIAEVPTTGCTLPALTQRAALHWAHRRVAPSMSYEVFIERLVGDASFRRASNVALRRFAIGC